MFVQIYKQKFHLKKYSFYNYCLLDYKFVLIITRPNSVRFGMVGWVALGEPAPRLAHIGTMVKTLDLKKKVDRVKKFHLFLSFFFFLAGGVGPNRGK